MNDRTREELAVLFDAILAFIAILALLLLAPFIGFYKLLKLAYQRATRRK